MKSSFFAIALGRGLLTSFGASLFLGSMLPSANAGPVVNPGTDYLRTPKGGSGFCVIPGPNPGDPCTFQLSFSGLPIGYPTANAPDGGYQGQADTVVNRKTAVDPMKSPSTNPITGLSDIGEKTDIEIIGLSLIGDSPVPLNGIAGMPDGTLYNYYAGLQKYYPSSYGGGGLSEGQMFIRDNGMKTWDSEFTIKGVTFFVPTSTPIVPIGVDFVRTAIEHFTTNVSSNIEPAKCENTLYIAIKACSFFTSGSFTAFNYPWGYVPLPDQILGSDLVGADDNNFYLTADPITGDDLVHHVAPNHIHDVVPRLAPTPAPLPILGASTAYAFARRLRKRCRDAVKVS
jgi:hypothetical protein